MPPERNLEDYRRQIVSQCSSIEKPRKRALLVRLVDRVAQRIRHQFLGNHHGLLKEVHLAAFPMLSTLTEKAQETASDRMDHNLFGLRLVASFNDMYKVYGRGWMNELCSKCGTIVEQAKGKDPQLGLIANCVIDIFGATATVSARPNYDGHYLASAWEANALVKIEAAKVQGIVAVADILLEVETEGAKKRSEDKKGK